MSTPIERVAALTIGTVESVSPSEIRVLLDPDAPQATAINTGSPTGFPRINGHVLIPNETGAVVGLIVWVGIERSVFPQRTGLKDFGLVDLPFPLRKLTLTPLGTLSPLKGRGSEESAYELERGVWAFPCVGDPVQLPTAEQLRGIIEAGAEADCRVVVGTSPVAAAASITVAPDKLFGRHLAVLGNTGSGKSCSVAGLIRWCIDAAKRQRADDKRPNSRFIVLDPNGEYARAFADFPNLRLFQVAPSLDDTQPLVLPAWMWNSHEWSAFAHAAPGVQHPLLLQALRDMRSGSRLREPAERQVARVILSYRVQIEARVAKGVSGYQGFPENKNCGNQLRNLVTDAETYAANVSGPLNQSLGELAATAGAVAASHYWQSAKLDGYNDFSETDLRQVIEAIETVLESLPDQQDEAPVSEDAPIGFSLSEFPDHLDNIAAQESGRAAEFVSTLTMRIRMMLADRRLGPIVSPSEEHEIAFDDWLGDYIGQDGASNGELAILDLSLVPSDVLHTVIAVVGRIVFEALQRYRKVNDHELPTVLVLEEAHTFVKRGPDDEDGTPTPAQVCRQTFERIAQEGRKFGLGLVLSSQRPSELSPTALAQCNTFLLHRIVNDRDQELLGRLVPDNLGGLLSELPSLPTRHAILLGWVTPVPTLVEVTELPEEQRPRSDDPHFWDVWTGKQDRVIDWAEIVEDWTGLCSGDKQAEGQESGAQE